jgi:hypothetical protein
VLLALLPTDEAQFAALHASTLAGLLDGPQKRTGLEWGAFVADRILAWRANDNADAVVPPPGSGGLGAWQPTPPLFADYLLPQWGFVMPFAIPTGAHFRPLGPPPLESARYAEEYDEMRALGAAVGSTRTPEQDLIAQFWADGAGTETPPGHWNSIAQRVAAARGNTLIENARLFALLNIAMADAAIAAWDAKYHFHSWRPVTAIRNGDLDGNPATVGDPSWRSSIATPPFPDYVSGHSTFSGAASRVLARFYGTDDVAFTTGSDFLPGVTRSFSSFSAAQRKRPRAACMAGSIAGRPMRTAWPWALRSASGRSRISCSRKGTARGNSRPTGKPLDSTANRTAPSGHFGGDEPHRRGREMPARQRSRRARGTRGRPAHGERAREDVRPFLIAVDVEAKRTTPLPFTIWMPVLGTVHATSLGLAGGAVSAAIDPNQDFTPAYAAASAVSGAVGGAVGGPLIPDKGHVRIGAKGFPRTWCGVTPRSLG